MGGKKTVAPPPAEPAVKKKTKRTEAPEQDSSQLAVEDVKDAVELSDAGDSVSKQDNQKLLNFLKYRADPGKNKKGEQLQEAQKVLEAGFFDTHLFSTNLLHGSFNHIVKTIQLDE